MDKLGGVLTRIWTAIWLTEVDRDGTVLLVSKKPPRQEGKNMMSRAETAAHYGNRRHRPAPVQYGYAAHGGVYFTYDDNSSLTVQGYGDLSEWAWNFRAEGATRVDYSPRR